jgi:GNAT superfamily N-acetyltransferase
MAQCRSTGYINASPEAVWELLADHAGMASWAPVRSAARERDGDPAPNGVGAIRSLGSATGRLREEITAFEPPRRIASRLLSGAPVRDYQALVELSPRDDGTEVAWSASFTTRVPGVRLVVSRTLAALVRGLVAETERRTDAGTRPPASEDRPRPDGSDIRNMAVADTAAVARSLARAFYDDPHFRWIIPQDATRTLVLEAGFRTFISRVWLPQGESYTHERLIGAALWMPPGTWRMSPLAQLRLLPAVARDMGANTLRLLRALTFIEKVHPHEPPHWYLPIIGVTPGWQGHGYGAALLNPVLERCDAERLPAYLEASTPRNLALYQRHGFEVVEECRYAKDGPPLWRMWREPNG